MKFEKIQILTIITTVFLAAVSCTSTEAPPTPTTLENSVTIRGTVIPVEVARTPALRTQGLSGRESLSADGGMLFVFEKKGSYGFWMKEMKFPLDIIWIADDKIVDIKPNLPPAGLADLVSYFPQTPANYVLEVNAGFAASHGWQTGDKVEINL